MWAVAVACSDASPLGPRTAKDDSGKGNPPGTVTDLEVASVEDSSVMLTFTQVSDGTPSGKPADYDIRYDSPEIGWGSASSVGEGSCATPVEGTEVGASLTCTVEGLTPETAYEFALVAFRGTLDEGAKFGEISNVAGDTTAATDTATEDSTPPPGQVTDLSVDAATDSSLTVSFTEVDDGTGQPADSELRYALSPIGWGWGEATVVTTGDCAAPVEGSAIGSSRSCEVGGLDPETTYDVQMVAFREDSAGRTYGELSNVATGVTEATDTASEDGGGGAGGTRPNEPSGFEAIADHGLSCIPGTSLCEGAAGSWWVDENRLDLISTVTEVTGLLTEEQVIEVTFPEGFDDGYAPARFDGWGPSLSWSGEDDYEQVYVSLWLKIQGPDFENQSVGTKVFYLAYANPEKQNQGFLMLEGNGSQSVMSDPRLEMRLSNIEGTSDPGAIDYDPNQGRSGRVSAGEWVHIEVLVDAGNPDASDGWFKIWLDGELTHHHTDIPLRSSELPLGLYHFQFTPVYGGNGGDVRTREDRWLVDELYISVGS